MVHVLLIYDRTTGRLLRTQRFEDVHAALQARFAAEAEFAGRSEIEIVALSAESDADLQRTHARYFLDIAALADRMG